MKTELAALCALFLLAGCDQSAREHDRAKVDLPQWSVVPASTSPYSAGNPNTTPTYSAWRLNTRTGALEFCYYDPGGYVTGTAVTPERLTCSKPVEAGSH